eukprot:scaffold10926_cov163-Amphora_coffeaeformis.AAC.8
MAAPLDRPTDLLRVCKLALPLKDWRAASRSSVLRRPRPADKLRLRGDDTRASLIHAISLKTRGRWCAGMDAKAFATSALSASCAPLTLTVGDSLPPKLSCTKACDRVGLPTELSSEEDEEVVEDDDDDDDEDVEDASSSSGLFASCENG